jgi:hypothetical protein
LEHRQNLRKSRGGAEDQVAISIVCGGDPSLDSVIGPDRRAPAKVQGLGRRMVLAPIPLADGRNLGGNALKLIRVSIRLGIRLLPQTPQIVVMTALSLKSGVI